MDLLTSLVIYNSIILSCIMLYFDKIYKNIYKIILPIMAIYIITMSAIRYNVGRDFLTYVDIFNTPYHIDRERFEIGFIILLDITKYIFEDSQFLFFTTSILIYLPILYSYKCYRSISILLVWFLLFYLISLNILRQSIAMSIIFYSFYFVDKNKIKYYLFSIIGILFHNVSLVALFFPLLSKLIIKYIEILVLFTPFLTFVKLNDIFKNFNNLSNYYLSYMDSEVYSGTQTLSLGGIIRLLVPFVFIFYFKKNVTLKINLIKNSMFIYISLYFLSINFYLLYRFYFIFQLLTPFACWYLIKEKRKFISLITYSYIIILFVLFQKTVMEATINPANSMAIFPYQTIFSINPIR